MNMTTKKYSWRMGRASNQIQDGIAVKKGTRWGSNKCLFFLDHNDWRQKLQGKEILDVKLYIRRRNTEHGYPEDGQFLHVWAHNYGGNGIYLQHHGSINYLIIKR